MVSLIDRMRGDGPLQPEARHFLRPNGLLAHYFLVFLVLTATSFLTFLTKFLRAGRTVGLRPVSSAIFITSFLGESYATPTGEHRRSAHAVGCLVRTGIRLGTDRQLGGLRRWSGRRPRQALGLALSQ